MGSSDNIAKILFGFVLLTACYVVYVWSLLCTPIKHIGGKLRDCKSTGKEDSGANIRNENRHSEQLDIYLQFTSKTK